VPCINGSTRVANLFIMDSDADNMRQLCFDQEHNWCPTVMHDGRVLYTRWEYTDTPHTHSRLLFRMNPDGTQQMEFYGSNSYWPNAMFYTRPIPGHASKVVTIVSGHHGVRRMGELVILDPAKGRHEAEGVVQRIPGYGKDVEPLIEDRLVDNSWPKFLHPYPLGDSARPDTGGTYFLVACQPSPTSLWGIYLVDVFDNLVLLREEPGYALFEPIPLRRTPRPPVVPDKVDLSCKDCTVQITDIYRGRGLQDIPRGTVKRLRVFTYTYDYPGMGGPQGVVGMEGPWDVRRILGTVPVAADGSANFTAPANTPLSLQPLDADGAALQIMRSWLTGMPGEVVSCVGCHESQNAGTPNLRGTAIRDAPTSIGPWRGPARGYSFQREVQPVLDRYCIGCHGLEKKAADISLIADQGIYPKSMKALISRGEHWVGLKKLMWDKEMEEQYNVSRPMRFYAHSNKVAHMLVGNAEKSSSTLVRIHHDQLKMDARSRLRIIEWLDLNAQACGDLFPNKVEERRIDGKAFGALRDYVKELFGDTLAGQPDLALVNPVIPEESRILMAPLPVTAGGWEQIKGYANRDAPAFTKMSALVEACVSRHPNENTRGWEPTREMGGGDEWFVESRKKLREELAARKE